MRIAYIVPGLYNTGPLIVLKELIENLINKVDKIDVYYFDESNEINLNCETYKISIFKKIQFENYDVIHTHMLRPDFYTWLHKKKEMKPIFISTIHQNIFDNLKGNYNFFIALIFEKIWIKILNTQDVLVTLTNVLEDNYKNKINKKIITIYNGRTLNINNKIKIEQEELFKITELKKKYKILGSHCLLTKRKGIDLIIKSLPSLKEFGFILIGDGKELNNLKQMSKELNVADRCLFLGYKKFAVNYLQYFDIYIMPSYSEGFGLGLLEAGLNMLPVVCSDIPIFKELYNDENVCFFKSGQTQSLIRSVIKCSQSISYYSKSLNKLVSSKYSPENMAKSYFNLYQKAI